MEGIVLSAAKTINLAKGLGMGFDFERFWLSKLRARLEVELLRSVMAGDHVCSFSITPLPRTPADGG